MKYILSLFALMLTLSVCHAQKINKDLYIDYKLITKEDTWKMRTEVIANAERCLSKTTRRLKMGAQGDGVEDHNCSYVYVFKDYTSNEMKFQDKMPNAAPVFVQEKMNLFKWQVGKEKKVILGRECQMAKAKFRGREYIAWFTTELPFKAAPWKIHGLPGVVLQVETTDEFLYLKAQNLRIQKPKSIENPNRKENYMDWEEFKPFYARKLKERVERYKAALAEMGVEGSSSYMPRPEVIIEMNRKVSESTNVEILKRRREI
jgi:GLPGLI family protein